MLDTDRFNVDIGDINGGDVDRGEPGIGGDTLLLLEIGGLEDQNLEKFSVVQAGILDLLSLSLLFLNLLKSRGIAIRPNPSDKRTFS